VNGPPIPTLKHGLSAADATGSRLSRFTGSYLARWVGTTFVLAGVLTAAAATAARAQTHVVLVSGLAAEPVYREKFHAWATALRAAAVRSGVPDSHVVYLAEDAARDPATVHGPATKERMAAAVRSIAAQAAPDATVFVVFFGHGSDRGEPRISLPGPDLSAAELSSMLGALPTQRIVVVNTASASGGFVPALSGPRRVVITATKSGFEQNHAIFGGFFVEAFGTPAADLDKDERISVLEAFLHAKAAVARAYTTDRRLLTEHALLDDNGDGEGATEPSATGREGSLAAGVFLGWGSAAAGVAAAAANDSTALALEQRRRDLEQRIAGLRARKDAMPVEAYERQLEELVVQLADVTRALRERTTPRSPE
jgi:hypothetical protein